ncbi:MAG: LysR family transcriptional regulator [Hespellia sp.]|nr:LysR family transcriptional regulator [Hespellia sp.]
MKIVQLEYFCAVSRYHSIAQASQQLFVTPPAISNAIKELEKEFSVSLFTRSKNHMTLTKEGEQFYRKASELLEAVNQTACEFADIGKQIIPIRIGIPPLLSTIFFPEMLMEFQRQYPDTPVELYEYGSIRAARMVQNDSLDLALVNMNFYEIDKLNSFQIISDQIVFCVSPDHHYANEKSITIEMLKDEPVLMYNTDSVQNSTLQTHFSNAGIKPTVIMHASQFYTIRNFIKQNLGGACLYSSLLHNMPGLIGIPFSPNIEQAIGIVWQKGRYVNSQVEKFIAFTKEYF